MSTNVQRDPFARGSYQRQTLIRGECAWCGQKAPQDRRRLYSYTWDDDASGTSRSATSRPFCGLACFHAYLARAIVRLHRAGRLTVTDQEALIHPAAFEEALALLHGFAIVLREAAVASDTLAEKVRFHRAKDNLDEARNLLRRSLFDYQDAHIIHLRQPQEEKRP